MIKKQIIQPIGMMQDNLITNPKSSQYAHEIKNLRFNTQGDYVTASWSTEQSTLKLTIEGLENNYLVNQIPVGQAVINDKLVLFTTNSKGSHVDRIIRFEYKDNNTLSAFILYEGNLNLSAEHPLETLSYYESELVQKVYWTDGINQPRVINIITDTKYSNTLSEIDYQFDFVKEVALSERISVSKQQGGAGQFPPGTVKYAITYYNKYGQESNIVWTSDLLYPTKGERGLKEDELSGDIFIINVDNVDTTHKFDYIRLYSIIRTTNGTTPVVRIVESKSISDKPKSVTFYDSNTTGDIIDSTILNYIGGVKITAETFDQKNNTLFLGNIKLQTKSLKGTTLKNNIDWASLDKGFTQDDYCKLIQYETSSNSFYPYNNQLNKGVFVRNYNIDGSYKDLNSFANPKTFKCGEWYRFGVQCQDKNGVWSDVVWLEDCQDTLKPISLFDFKKYPVYKYKIKKETAVKLTDNDYKKARLVCCYTNNNDRSVLAQGILCPTVYNNKWKENHTPDYASSWFYRFKNEVGNHIYNEIQSTISESELAKASDKRFDIDGDGKGEEILEYNNVISGKDPDYFFTCSDNVVTFHSPEIEFDNSIRTLDWSKLKLRCVGNVTINQAATKLYLDYISQAQDFLGNKGTGFDDSSKVFTNIRNYNRPLYYWNDIDVYNANLALSEKNSTKKGQIDFKTYNYPIYPFQRKYLNNYMGDLDRPVVVNNGSDIKDGFHVGESSIIENKVFSEIFNCKSTLYTSYTNINIADCKLFDSLEVLPLILKNGSSDDIIYYGNVNTLSPISNFTIKTPIYEYQGLYPIGTTTGEKPTIPGISGCEEQQSNVIKFFKGSYLSSAYVKIGGTSITGHNKGMYIGVASDPIRISYKSTPHCAINLATPLPALSDNITLHVAELYRDVDESQRFGGTSEDALKNNIFIPCGSAVDLKQYVNGERSDVMLIGDIGDTYYMRYDNLKTYPFTREEDKNGIVEILSFMCETRINLDGRSDINRGLIDNTTIDNTNFNYINTSYTQTDNYFNYKVLDDTSAIIDDFPNQITWTKTKNSGEEIDSWTNITLASVADAEGVLGNITKIINNKDTLYMFQEHGFAVLGYNEKTAISTQNGVPLEIANSGKFTGFGYISKKIGCQNKWSINSSREAFLWIDDSQKQLIQLTEEGVKLLSTVNGFDAFFINNLEHKPSKWNPLQFKSNSSNFVTYYDNLTKDIYYINDKYCITYNEIIGTFTAFYDYNKVPYMSNISQHCIATYLNGDNTELYSLREGANYSNFFGNTKPYWITLMSNGGADNEGNYSNSDKIFNIIEYKGDLYDESNPVLLNNINMINMPLFTDIAAFNGYQTYKEFKIDGRNKPIQGVSIDLQMYKEYPWNAERKFNLWRVIIPRATYSNSNGELYTNKDRIRGLFTYIKLINNEPERLLNDKPNGVSNHRAVFSNFIISFDIR